MWKIIIVEDELPILQLLQRLLSQAPEFEVVAAFSSSEKALNEIPHLHCDVLLFDIEMPRISGLDLAHKLVLAGIDVPVIFSTAYPQYALEAFKVQALDYVLKPMTPKIVSQMDERLQKYYGVKIKQMEEVQPIIDVSILGEPMVRVNNQIVVKWPTKVTEELFYYFLLHANTVCSKWRIIDSLWPNMDEKRGTSNLYNTIYRLRQLFSDLGVPIQIDRLNEGYMFVTGDIFNVDWQSWYGWMKENSAHLHDVDPLIINVKYQQYKGELLETKGYLWSLPLQYQTHEEWNRLEAFMERTKTSERIDKF